MTLSDEQHIHQIFAKHLDAAIDEIIDAEIGGWWDADSAERLASLLTKTVMFASDAVDIANE